MNLGKIGIWTSTLDYQPWPLARQAAAEIESLGFGALWFPEAVRREALSNASILLASTQRIVVATGIANIYARDAVAMGAGQKTIAAAFPDRFLLGLGVSHRPSVQARGHDYGKPVQTMRVYLDAMDAAPFQAAAPQQEPPRVLAALGPRMLELAKERSWGAHPYFVPVEHTRRARQLLGRGPLLAPEQAVVLETDPTRARAIARLHTKYYLALTNYAGNLRRLGYSDEDLAGEGSDRLVDDIVGWGDIDRIAARVQDHLRAGADHVSVQVLTENPRHLPSEQWRVLAGALPMLI